MTTPIVRRWLLDLGNTRLKCAELFTEGQRGDVEGIAHEQDATWPSLPSALLKSGAQCRIWLASVASPTLTDALVQTLQVRGFVVQQVHTQSQSGRLQIAYAEPARLGVDRFLAMRAVVERTDGPWLIVSLGSAWTVDLIDAHGGHRGGLIAPPPALMQHALGQRVSQLDLPEGNVLPFADNSRDAVTSGAWAAALGMVERSQRAAHERLGVMPTMVLTGGGASQWLALDARAVVHLPALVLDGLAIIAQSES